MFSSIVRVRAPRFWPNWLRSSPNFLLRLNSLRGLGSAPTTVVGDSGIGGSTPAAATFPIGCTAVRGATGGDGAIGGSMVCCLTTASSKLLLAATATGSSCAFFASVGAPCTAFVVCTALKKRKATSVPLPKSTPSSQFLNLPSNPTSLGSDFK